MPRKKIGHPIFVFKKNRKSSFKWEVVTYEVRHTWHYFKPKILDVAKKIKPHTEL